MAEDFGDFQTLSAEELKANMAPLRRWIEVGWNQRDTSVIPELFAGSYLAEGGATKQLGIIRGHADLAADVDRFHEAVENLRFEILNLHVCGEIAMIEYTIRGVFRAPLLGTESAGDVLDVTAVDVYRFKDGQIAQRMVAYEQRHSPSRS